MTTYVVSMLFGHGQPLVSSFFHCKRSALNRLYISPFVIKEKKNAVQVWNGTGFIEIGKCDFILNFHCTNFLNLNLFGGWLMPRVMHLYFSPRHLILHRIRSF